MGHWRAGQLTEARLPRSSKRKAHSIPPSTIRHCGSDTLVTTTAKTLSDVDEMYTPVQADLPIRSDGLKSSNGRTDEIQAAISVETHFHTDRKFISSSTGAAAAGYINEAMTNGDSTHVESRAYKCTTEPALRAWVIVEFFS